MHIADLLSAGRSLGVDRLDVQLLLSHHLRQPRSWLLAHDKDTLPAAISALCLGQLQRRAAGEPLAYLLGEWQFRGLTLQVSPAVLIPRPETEVLVDWALDCLAAAPLASVVDLGTGSGAIALALAAAVPGLQITASDASPEALALARSNASRLGLPVHLAQGDWWAAVDAQRFGLAVSNPPYVAAGDAHLGALRHEPSMALTPGGDGLDALRRIVDGAPAHLLEGAWLLVEHGHDQAEAVRAMLAGRGFEHAATRCDLAGLPRCSGGCWTHAG